MSNVLRGAVTNPEKVYGKSAYEIAVMNGFEGTEEEWIVHLETSQSESVKEASEKANKDIEEARQEMLSDIELAAEIVQTTGGSATAVMSQKAVTDVIADITGGCVKTFSFRIEHSSETDQVPFDGKANDVVLITLENEAGVGGFVYCYGDGAATEGTSLGSCINGETVERRLPVDCDRIGVYLYAPNNSSEATVKFKVKRKDDSDVVQVIGSDEKDKMSQKAVTDELYEKNEVDLSQYSFSQGTLVSGVFDESPWRCVTHDFITIPEFSRLFANVVDGYQFEVDFYDSNKTYLTDTGWIVTSKEIDMPENARYIHVLIAFDHHEEITPDVAIDKAKLVFYINKFEKLDAKLEERTNEIPTYWEGAVSEAEYKIEQYQNDGVNTFTFGFITDTHVFADTSDTFAKLMGRVLDTCDIPMFLHGGDIVIGYGMTPRDTLIAQIKHHKKIFKSIEDKCLLAFGNHDSSYGISGNWDSALTDGEIYNYIFRKDQGKSDIVFGDTGRYFYKDIPSQKVRYIVLDCYDFKTTLNGNTVVTNNKMYGGAKFGTKQLEWLANTALKVDDGYSVVICSHQPPYREADKNAIGWSGEDSMVDATVVVGIVNAFRNKTTVHYYGDLGWDSSKEYYAINFDFTDYKGDLVCWIAGHTHKDYIFNLDGLKVVCTANCSSTRSETEPEYSPVKSSGTDTEHVLDFLCVNKATRTCNIVRLGAELESNADGRSFTY